MGTGSVLADDSVAPRALQRLLDEAERWLRGQEWEVALTERHLVVPED